MESLLHAFGIEWKVLIAQSINFGLLVAGLTFFLYKPVLKLLNDRQEKIAKGVKDAEEATTLKAEIEGQKNDILTKAEREAEDVVARAVDKGKEEKDSIVQRAQSQSDTILDDARKQAEELQKRAMKESEKEIARAAILAAEKILQTK